MRATQSTVIVLDDLGEVRRLVSAMLRAEGYSVVETRSVDEAVAALGDEVALMLTDVELPGRSGVELIEASKGQRPGLPVIAMSGNAMLLYEASRAGADALLLKPFTRDELMLTIEVSLAPGQLST